MARLEIRNLSKAYGAAPAVDRVDIDLRDGGFLALLGPSGCGKTTLLRMIAGFETPDSGEISFDGEMVSRPGLVRPPEHREVGMVFQSYALWPHMTVEQNVGFALKVRRIPQLERAARVRSALELVGLAALSERKPAALSGGQRQRVALARCLAMRPRLILLDEPLANLDAHLREAMIGEFGRFRREAKTTFVYVTHDQFEAMGLAEQIAVMEAGRIAQYATPQTLFREPASETIARFIGAGVLLDARSGDKDGEVAVEGVRVRARGQATAATLRLCARPGDMRLATQGEAGIPARIVDARFQGAHWLVGAITAGGQELRFEHRGDLPGEPQVRIAIGDAWIIPPG